MNEIKVTVEVDGEKYRAIRDEQGRVSISRWNTDGFWEWSGNGKWDGDAVRDCPARIGDDAYEAIDAAILDSDFA